MRRSISLHKDWEQIKVKVMHEIVQTEFEQRGQILMAVREYNREREQALDQGCICREQW